MKNLLSILLVLTILGAACAAPADPLEPVFEPAEVNVASPPPAAMEEEVEPEVSAASEEALEDDQSETAGEVPPDEVDAPVFAWPVISPTPDQIVEAQVCDLANLPRNRYAGEIPTDQLREAYAPVSACDWAVLALAYVERLEEDESLPPDAVDAYLQGIQLNPALALRTQIFYAYFGTASSLVAVPPFFNQQIAAVDVRYEWNGLGNPASYQVAIKNANTGPTITGEILAIGEPLLQSGEGDANDPTPGAPVLPATVDPGLIQGLGMALHDFWPVSQPFNVFACNDNFPDWFVTLTFEDGSTLELVTVGSNFLPSGGPWQAIIDGQAYVQLSAQFSDGMNALMTALGLPLGQPLSMSCFPDEAIFDYAYDILGG